MGVLAKPNEDFGSLNFTATITFLLSLFADNYRSILKWAAKAPYD